MKQASLKLNLNVKKTRKQVFLEQMGQVSQLAAQRTSSKSLHRAIQIHA
jgi:hypothetical protein